MELKQILEKENISEYQQDIRMMSKAELIEHFGAVSSGKPKATIIIKNQIWQTYNKIKQGQEEKIEGNIRTYWYSHIKSTLDRVGLLNHRHDHYETMLNMFNELTRKYKLFKYADFGFDDPKWENRRIATDLFNVILFAEKTGWFRTLKNLHKEYGMNVVVLGGTPSLISTEYFVQQLSEITNLGQKFYLISSVDYDPSGFIIARSFAEQLKNAGLKEVELINLVLLENYTEREIELFRYTLPSKYKIKVNKGIKETNGIYGEAYGLEADSMPRSRYKELVRKTLKRLEFIT